MVAQCVGVRLASCPRSLYAIFEISGCAAFRIERAPRPTSSRLSPAEPNPNYAAMRRRAPRRAESRGAPRLCASGPEHRPLEPLDLRRGDTM